MDSGYKHFIRTIRSGVEIKVCNIDSHRRSALAFKTLTEVCESGEAKRLRRPCIIDSANKDKDTMLPSDQMKSKMPRLSKADRKLSEIKPRTDNLTPSSDNDMGSDLDDDTTLEQLKKISKAKREKRSCIGLHSVKADEDERKLQDEFDLDEPLIRLKLKLPKNSNAKRKCVNGSFAMPSTISFAVKSEQNPEDSLLVGHETAPVIHIKAEAPEAEQLGCQSTSFADHLSIDHDKGSSYYGVATNNILEVVQSENREPLLPAEECKICLTSEMSYEHLEDIEPTCMVVPLDCVDVKGENLDLSCPEFLVLPPTVERRNEDGRAFSCRSEPSEPRNSDVLLQSSVEEISYPSNSSGIQVSDMAVDDIVGCMGLNNHGINNKHTKDKDKLDFPEKQNDYLKKQESSPENKAYGGSHVHSTPEQHQHPERLLSTRKAISPSTQEKLRLAMESIELCNDVKKCSLGKFTRRKVTCPRQMIQKSKKAQGNLESPHIARSIPSLTTGRASIQYCSESAIVFSQRQMHDIESLAGKLMSELKSMKDIVVQKLLFEAHRNASMKNGGDEVKLAIDNATKTEEAATKWLNMMSRDCNRFCKIMELAPNNIDTYKYAAPREGKKIKFADEAGGELCHVNFFEGTAASPVSDCIEQ